MKVKDLPVWVGTGPNPMLYCRVCGGEYSAHRGDYFMSDPEKTMRCCGQPLRLVRKVTRYVAA